jgi:hypothetical protein
LELCKVDLKKCGIVFAEKSGAAKFGVFERRYGGEKKKKDMNSKTKLFEKVESNYLNERCIAMTVYFGSWCERE